MAISELLTARTEADANAAWADARPALEAIFAPGDWGTSHSIQTYTGDNINNIWNNELRGSIKTALEAAGVDADSYGQWLREVHFVSVAVYWRGLFGEDYRANAGWRLTLLGIPAAQTVAVGVASHYQNAQNHNQLGRASNLLFDFAAQHLGVDSFGRKVAPADWDRTGLLAAPITSIAGVQVQPDQDGNGLFLKDVRTTTLKKILASFISIDRLGAVGLTDAQLTPVLARLEHAGRQLVTGYPFSDLRQFEQVRALAYTDLAAAQIRLQLHRQPQTRSIVKIHFGPPGTGKTLSAVRDAVKLVDPAFTTEHLRDYFRRFNELHDQVAFITFHPSLQYEDVVESIRPTLVQPDASEAEAGEEAAAATDSKAELRYHLHEGPLMRLIRRAAENPHNEYAVVIDEINRGDVSRILGPLISAIEPDKRAGAEFPIGFESQYPRAADLETRIFMPSNLHVIGTMNSADRNIALVDHALRRRFEFVEVPPDPELLGAVGASGVDLRRLLTTLNERIAFLLDRDHCIGHGYFLGCQTDLDVITTFAKRLLPLLAEYFFGNEAQLLLVIGHQPGSQDNIFKAATVEASFEQLFGVTPDDAVALGYRSRDLRASLTINPRFWNATKLVPGPDDEPFAVSVIKRIYGGAPAAAAPAAINP